MQTGTSVYLEALPAPSKLSMSAPERSNAKQLLDVFNKTQQENMLKYGVKQPLVSTWC